MPTMSWDPAVASACLAAASGEPVNHLTEAPEAMVEQGPEGQEDMASSPEEVAPADPHPEVSTVSLLPWGSAHNLHAEVLLCMRLLLPGMDDRTLNAV